MRTVITDNSLCAYTLKDDASPGLIYNYIEALRDAGVRYVELDFRALMKLKVCLPKGVGYILRLMDPMFAGLADAIKFDYMLVTPKNLKMGMETETPMMLEFSTPDVMNIARMTGMLSYAVRGKITAVRVRSSFPMFEDLHGWTTEARRMLALPIDICPINEQKTALDAAMKFTAENIESLTLTMGNPKMYCSVEDYIFTLMTVFEVLPRNYDVSALCRASVYQSAVFRNAGGDGITRVLDVLDRDIDFMTNVDTGKKVNPRAIVRNRDMLRHEYVSALEFLAKNEKWSSEDYNMITDNLRRLGDSFYNPGLIARNNNNRGYKN